MLLLQFLAVCLHLNAAFTILCEKLALLCAFSQSLVASLQYSVTLAVLVVRLNFLIVLVHSVMMHVHFLVAFLRSKGVLLPCLVVYLHIFVGALANSIMRLKCLVVCLHFFVVLLWPSVVPVQFLESSLHYPVVLLLVTICSRRTCAALAIWWFPFHYSWSGNSSPLRTFRLLELDSFTAFESSISDSNLNLQTHEA